MNKSRKQSDSTYPLLFLMVDSTDHVTGKTGLSPTVTISKNSGSFASPSGAVSEIGNGWYKIAGNATDSNTVGELLIHATGTAADPTDTSYTVVPYDPFDAVRLGLTALPNAAAEAAGGLYTRGTGAGQINQPANGKIDANTVTVSGTTQTARDIGASVLLSSGTGTGQISLSSGAVLLQATQAGVTIPTVTNLTNAPTNGDLTATMKTSVTTAATAATPTVASVSGAVGSVTSPVTIQAGTGTGQLDFTAGVVKSNMTQIDGLATAGNNATLYLKHLNVVNSGGSAIVAQSTGNDGHGIFARGHSKDSAGIVGLGGFSAGTAGTGIAALAGDTSLIGSGDGFQAIGGASGSGIRGAGPNGIVADGSNNGGKNDFVGTLVGNIEGSINSLAAQAKADVNAEVKDVMETDTQTEPTGVPSAASSFKDKIGWIFARLRNKQKLTKASGVEVIYADDSVTPIGTSTDTDDTVTFTKGKMS